MRRRKSREKQIYYGMALLAAVFIVVGLTAAVKGGSEKGAEVSKVAAVKPEDEKKADEARTKEKEGQKSDEDKKVKADNPDIRVLLMTNGFSDATHSQVTLASDSGMTVTYGNKKKIYKGKKVLKLKPDHRWFKKGTVRVKALDGKLTVKSIKRGDGMPSYDGVIELRSTAEGIAVINELPVEK